MDGSASLRSHGAHHPRPPGRPHSPPPSSTFLKHERDGGGRRGKGRESSSCLANPPARLHGPKPYVDTLATLYGLTQSEREHLLYSVKGNALLVRQGDPRPRKTRIKPHSEAL